MIWEDYFYYDESSPTSLRWKVARYGGEDHNRILVVDAGDIAGCVTLHGYGEVKLDGKSYKTHRIIWEMSNGSLRAGEDIDHIDGDRLNNKPGNLRICDDQINSQNRKKRSDNTSGTTGVTRYINKQGREYWIARWTDIKGREGAKSFRIDVWGDEEAYRIAVVFREMKIESLKAQGLFYTERHGK